jgi:hypothetical protein
MQSSILVKPNLKLILLGALLIAVLHDVFTSGKSEPSSFAHSQYRASWLSDEELSRLIEKVDAAPHSSGYMLISQVYEKRGDMRRALYFMKKAQAIGPLEDLEE